jgi:DNA primase
MKYPAEVYREIREVADIVEVISKYIDLKKSGNNYMALCPFHLEKSPSFYVSPDKNIYHCFGCGASGDVIKFVSEIEKISLSEAVEKLARDYGVDISKYKKKIVKERVNYEDYTSVYNRVKSFYNRILKTEHGSKAMEYLRNRGLSDSDIEEYGLGFSLPKWDFLVRRLKDQNFDLELMEKFGLIRKNQSGNYYDFFRNRIMFPIIDLKGNVIAFGARTIGTDKAKYINTPDTKYFNKSNVLYGLNEAKYHIRDFGYIVIVEGYFDVIAMHKNGFKNTVATLGTSLTKEHATLLSRFTDKIIMMFDSDQAGQKAISRSIDVFSAGAFDIKIANIPDTKDPDEFFKEHDHSEMKDILDSAQSIDEFIVNFLLKNKDINKISDKKLIIKELANWIILLKRIGDNLISQSITAKVAEKLGLSMEELYKQINYFSRYRYVRKTTKNESEIANIIPEQYIIYFLTHHEYSYLYNKIASELEIEGVNEDFREIIQNLFIDNDINAVADSISVPEVKKIFMDTVNSTDILIAEGKEEEVLNDCMLFFRKRRIEKAILAVDKKIREAQEEGNYEEQMKLEKERLKLLNILKG